MKEGGRRGSFEGRPRRKRGRFQNGDGEGDRAGFSDPGFLGDGFRQVLVNGLAWVAKLETPETGVVCAPVTPEELQKTIDEAKAAFARAL